MLKQIVRGLVGGLLQLALFAVALVVPAGLVPGGTWYWPRALIFLGLYGVVLEAAVVTLAVVAPASLAARLSPPASKKQPTADRIATAFLVIATLGWFVFAIPIVEDQTDRAQVLVETGLYARLRHPMYLGILLFHAGLALWLELRQSGNALGHPAGVAGSDCDRRDHVAEDAPGLQRLRGTRAVPPGSSGLVACLLRCPLAELI
jgi:hypothetical protein